MTVVVESTGCVTTLVWLTVGATVTAATSGALVSIHRGALFTAVTVGATVVTATFCGAGEIVPDVVIVGAIVAADTFGVLIATDCVYVVAAPTLGTTNDVS